MKQRIATAIIALLLTATPVPHECGDGPVEVTITVPGGDCNTCTTSHVRTGDSEYMQGLTSCTLMACYTTVKQHWSDWPECGGRALPPTTTEKEG